MSAYCSKEEPAQNSSTSSAGGGKTQRTGEQKLEYQDLPTATSIRLLDIIESKNEVIQCKMQVADLDDSLRFAALSYTWGNPITIYEEPMPDITNFKLPEDADQLPFACRTSSIEPEGEFMVIVDGSKLNYYAKRKHVPHEEVCWKKGTARKIEVNGSPVFVEENLFSCLEALVELRERFNEKRDDLEDHLYDTTRQLLWVDALCVNQADLVERAAQVQLMGRVFKSAYTVFAWIGQADGLSSFAHSSVEMILDFDDTRPHAQDSSNPNQQEVSLSSIPGMTIVHWFALFALVQRLWFRRAWVAQEAIFAKNMIMICGSSMLSMEFLLTVFAFLHTTGLDYDLFNLGRNFLTGRPVSGASQHWEKLISFSTQAPSTNQWLRVEPRDAMSFILGYHHVRGRLGLSNAGMPMSTRHNSAVRWSRWRVDIPEVLHLSDHTMETVVTDGMPGFRLHRKPLRLLSVLSNFRNLDATDPRDKIFAFLNLAEDKLDLVPDYYADVRDVFRKAAEAMIRKTWTLSVLSHVQDPSETRIKGLPSWVPDFSSRLGRTPFDQGGEDRRFRAGISGDLVPISFNSDGTLDIYAIKVENVSTSTDLDGDTVIQAVKLALYGTANYPIEPLAWMCGSYEQLNERTINRVEALWRTLIADDVIREEDDDYGILDSRNNLGIGFASWILTDILEARDLLAEHSKLDPGQWPGKLTHNSFCTRMALWSAMRDGRQLFSELEVPDITGIVDDLKAKIKEEEDDEVFSTEEEGGAQSPRKFFNFLPTARHISKCFPDPADDQMSEDPLTGKYKTASMLRLTLLEQRKLRNFEKHMRKSTEARKLFLTESGLFGLGPKSLGQDPQHKDEVWILIGARVPFILRRDEGNRYRIVGEAYIHGIMYEGVNFDCWPAERISLI